METIVENIDQSPFDVSGIPLKKKLSLLLYIYQASSLNGSLYTQEYVLALIRYVCLFILHHMEEEKKLAHSSLSSQFLIRDAIYR